MADRLLVASFATAHVTGLTIFGVLILHASSSLGEFLAPVGTVTGSLFFGVLWTVAVVTHHYGFETVDPLSIGDRKTAVRFLGTGFVCGALTGAGTFWGLAVVGIGSILLSDPSRGVDLFAVPAALIALIGTAVSLVIGGVIGIVAAVFDVGVLSAVKQFV